MNAKTETENKLEEKILINSEKTEENENEDLVKLSKTYIFDGKQISELDLSAAREATRTQLKEADKIYRKITESPSVTPEFTDDFAIAFVQVITGIPLEFFLGLRAKDIMKLKYKTMGFLNGTD